jgi:hypothetical protein
VASLYLSAHSLQADLADASKPPYLNAIPDTSEWRQDVEPSTEEYKQDAYATFCDPEVASRSRD